MKKLEEENEVNKYLCEEKIPKEIEAMTAACRNLENVMSVPAMGQSELDEIHDKVRISFDIYLYLPLRNGY